MSGSQLTSSVKRGSPTLSTSASVAGAGSWPTCSLPAQRSARLSSRAPRSSSSASAVSCANGSQSRPPRSSAARRELVGQLAGDRLQHERAAPVEPRGADAADPAARRVRQPRADLVGDDQRRVALDHALDVRRGGVGLRRPPLLRVPVEPAARDRAHRVDDVGPVGEREDHVRVAVAVGAELDVLSGLHEAHETSYGSAAVGCDPCGSRASTAPSRRSKRPGSRSPTRACCAATAASRSCASTAAARSPSRTTSPGWRTRARGCGWRPTWTRSARRRSRW